MYDVAIVGGGPVGLTAANLTSSFGLRTLLIEREVKPFLLPRAIHLNGDVLRVFQSMGLDELLRAQMGVPRGMTMFGADGLPNVIATHPASTSSGWMPQYSFYQPVLEATIRNRLFFMPDTTLRFGAEFVDFQQDADGVSFTFRADGEMVEARAAYMLACDGARSGVRSALGIGMDKLGPSDEWAVVDIFLDPASDLPADQTHVYCSPDRPAVYVPGPGPHRRFEWLVREGEVFSGEAGYDAVLSVLSDFCDLRDVEVIRHTAYMFGANVAKRWRVGRLFLAGDAAHLTPPFLGQGVGHGVRDVANLAWKLDRVLRGAAGGDLLDTYQAERDPHVREVIARAIQIGEMASIGDATAAAERDRAMRQGRAIERPDEDKVMPALSAGFIGEGVLAGTVFPQSFLTIGGRRRRFDDVVGLRTALVTVSDVDRGTAERIASQPDICWLDLAAQTSAPTIKADEVRRWLDAAVSEAVLIRPDRYVYDHCRADRLAGLLDAYLNPDRAGCLRGSGTDRADI